MDLETGYRLAPKLVELQSLVRAPQGVKPLRQLHDAERPFLPYLQKRRRLFPGRAIACCGVNRLSMSADISGGKRQVDHCLAGFAKPFFAASFFAFWSSGRMSMPSASQTIPSHRSFGTVSRKPCLSSAAKPVLISSS